MRRRWASTRRSPKRIVFLAASLLTGAAVAFAGVIGFVGLLVPHAVRAVAGQRPARLLPLAALAGAALLVPPTPFRGPPSLRRSCRSARSRPPSARRSSPGCSCESRDDRLLEARGLDARYGRTAGAAGARRRVSTRARSSRSWARTARANPRS